ncbi:SDR family NAD(P)-dependent oxidoreductase [Salinirubrum litoreum]|uniref:SDR family NAD(P)-dependent oxidoreductase n=1 Tax=Salinirubrum litoreum TaxID=1126234 RepID=A0ABD5R6S9_9EURY|nr:SDR family NAD(P)-dependent oxidoreductase [Salinirubrum litoreum]
MTDSAIIVGASSGIGEALAYELADEGYEVGLAARRLERLQEIGSDLPTKAYVAKMDVTEVEEARDRLRRLIDAMGGCDLLVLSAGVGDLNPDLDWEPERQTVDVNVRGFTALATLGMQTFAEQGSGHLVGISSVAANFGNGGAPAYNASKAYVARYLEGLRYWADNADADITVTDVEPGFVDTKMAMGDELFWMASPETAAEQIASAIRAKRRHVYVTRRWRLVAWLLSVLPERVLSRLFD